MVALMKLICMGDLETVIKDMLLLMGVPRRD
jgi:hypothetical protein